MIAPLLPLLVVTAIGSPASGGRIFSGAYGPKGEVCFLGGPVVWEIWPEKPDLTVTKTVIMVDGKALVGRYDSESQRLSAALPASLAQGSHEIRCHVELSDRSAYDKKWDFSFRPDPELLVPAAGEPVALGLAAVNQVRRSLGLPGATLNPGLGQAARAHAHYLALNRDSGHGEVLGKAGFFGLDPGMRAARAGYVGPSFECVETGSKTFAESVPRLFDAPLHRIPFLQPGRLEVGVALEGNRTTIEFSATKARRTVVSPGPGASGIAISWQNNELPDPLEGLGAPLAVGYPIVIGHFEPSVRASDRPAKLLTADRQPVGCYSISKDMATYGYRILVPKKPLEKGATYEIVYTGRDLLGAIRETRSRFTTAP